VLWVSLATVLYVLVGLGFYFVGFRFFKKLNESLSRAMRGPLKDRTAASVSFFEGPQSRSLVIFFKGLGIFLMLAGVTFFLVMMHSPTPHR
jgi:hypothetical protein